MENRIRVREVIIPDLVVLLNANLNRRNNTMVTSNDITNGTNVSENHTSCLLRL